MQVSILLLFSFLFECFYFLFRVNVCSRVVYVQESYQALVQYTALEAYSTCCTRFIWCLNTCTKTRWEIIYQSCSWKNFFFEFLELLYKITQEGKYIVAELITVLTLEFFELWMLSKWKNKCAKLQKCNR